MSRYYWISFLLFLAHALAGQSCLPGGITLTTQGQIDDFPSDYPGCTRITGNLTISEATPGTITNLSGLSQLTAIDGRVLIFDNSNLASLSGLESVVLAGSSWRISRNASLTSLAGLEGLNDVASFLQVDANAELQDLSGLTNLQTIGGRLIIENNDRLTSLDGLAALATIGEATLEIRNNPLLTDVGGPAGLAASSILELIIVDNPGLAVCAEPYICDFLAEPGSLATISGNATGCASAPEVEVACRRLPVSYRRIAATTEGKQVRLSWSVSEQEDNRGFSILHSVDGANWRVVGWVDAHPAADYSFRHDPVNSGRQWYRLRQEDYTGAETLSAIIVAEVASGELICYPNPVRETLYLRGLTDPGTQVTLTDGNGRRHYRVVRSGKIPVGDLPGGIYILAVPGGAVHRIIIK